MKNWKTSFWGIVVIVAALSNAVVAWHNGQSVDWHSVLNTIKDAATGAGLIAAADGTLLKLLWHFKK